jgi:uncharacterized membrane-anchored protein YitT (DUF2179 family)
MNSFIRNLIEKRARRKLKREEDLSEFRVAKGYYNLKKSGWRWLRDAFMMTAGVFSAAFGLEGFLLPNTFIDGGATGIALLTSEVTNIPLSILLLLINIPFILMAFRTVGRQFAIKTAVCITALSIVLALIHFPEVTHDRLLVSVFGGFFLGMGIGLSVRGGSVLDGTEVVAIYLSKKLSTTIGDIIIGFNIIIFSFAAYLLSIESALYSMITYLVAARTIDFVIEGIEEYMGITIISAKDEEIKEMIIYDLGRGVTVYKGVRGFGKKGETKDVDIIYTVITRLEISRIKAEVEKIDPHAFVVMSSVKDTKGGIIKKRPMSH